MKIVLSTTLAAPADTVWFWVSSQRTLDYVAAPLVRFQSLDPPVLPERWEEGCYLVRLWFLGLIPLGTQWIVISYPPAPEQSTTHCRRLRDNGTGQLAQRWDHLITVCDAGNGHTLYTDEVTVEAGVLTMPTFWFARLFYHHRQRRWRRLASQGFRPLQTGEGAASNP